MKLDIRVNYNGIRINGLCYILIVDMYVCGLCCSQVTCTDFKNTNELTS